MPDGFERAIIALRDEDVPDAEISRALVGLVPVDGGSVATFGQVFGNETVSKTDEIAGRIDELQFDFAEGPCWDAVERRAPVLEGDVRALAPGRWPAVADALVHEDVGALFAFPLLFGPFRLGAIDLYAIEPMSIAADDVRKLSFLSSVVGRRLLRRSLSAVDEDGVLMDRGTYSRRVVHQATGVVLAQLEITPEDAQLLIQGHAFAGHRGVREVADDIVSGRLRFVTRNAQIEADDA